MDTGGNELAGPIPAEQTTTRGHQHLYGDSTKRSQQREVESSSLVPRKPPRLSTHTALVMKRRIGYLVPDRGHIHSGDSATLPPSPLTHSRPDKQVPTLLYFCQIFSKSSEARCSTMIPVTDTVSRVVNSCHGYQRSPRGAARPKGLAWPGACRQPWSR